MHKDTRQIGSIIRDLRKKQNITGEELGRLANLSQSKISKIETGFYVQLQHDEIKKILNILHAPSTISQQLLRALNDHNSEDNFQAAFRGINPATVAYDLERRSRLVKIYTAHAVPALLQTVEYRLASLKCKGINDSETGAFIKSTLKRQDLLYEGQPKFHIIMPQTALYTFAGSKKVQLTQLDRLERIITLPNLELGFIPTESGLPLIENGSFALYDKQALIQGIAQGEITSHDQQNIELHHKIFASLTQLADYDEAAVRLLCKAKNYFS